MDSPIVTQLFRRLFRHGHPACHARRNLVNLAVALHHGRHLRQLRAMSSDRGGRGGPISMSEKELGWQQRNHLLPKDKTEEAKRYPTVTAMDLRGFSERPRRVQMLLRDFIEGQPAQPSPPSLPVPGPRALPR